MLISAGCTFFLFLSFSQSAIIALQCLFCGVSAAAWNGIEVVTVELYPASKRYHIVTAVKQLHEPTEMSHLKLFRI